MTSSTPYSSGFDGDYIGQPDWMPYGRYIVQGGSLMFTLADGTRELWQRQA